VDAESIPCVNRISRDSFVALTQAACGLEVAHTWRGYGSAIFLEIGRLTWENRKNNPRGVFSVMLEWSWRVESARRIAFGSWSGDRKIASGLRALKGRAVDEMRIDGRLPELVISLSGSRWVHSFMTSEGQPRWPVALPDGSWVEAERGVVVRKNRSGNGPQSMA
jgi:hypothetical protein